MLNQRVHFNRLKRSLITELSLRRREISLRVLVFSYGIACKEMDARSDVGHLLGSSI
ncbi:hypothetical protein Mapa_009257 [Marchantia paleacea]|nr:hypothetical protein Mapa_009257 [Marchantia paleacea]